MVASTGVGIPAAAAAKLPLLLLVVAVARSRIGYCWVGGLFTLFVYLGSWDRWWWNERKEAENSD